MLTLGSNITSLPAATSCSKEASIKRPFLAGIVVVSTSETFMAWADLGISTFSGSPFDLRNLSFNGSVTFVPSKHSCSLTG